MSILLRLIIMAHVWVYRYVFVVVIGAQASLRIVYTLIVIRIRNIWSTALIAWCMSWLWVYISLLLNLLASLLVVVFGSVMIKLTLAGDIADIFIAFKWTFALNESRLLNLMSVRLQHSIEIEYTCFLPFICWDFVAVYLG